MSLVKWILIVVTAIHFPYAFDGGVNGLVFVCACSIIAILEYIAGENNE